VRIAVLTLTRDRLWATEHCFDRLYELAGCEFDHYVFDNGSEDGTWEWLDANMKKPISRSTEGNIGVSRGINYLLDLVGPENYDVIVKFDNDCELLVDGTLKACAEVALAMNWITSPHIQGLNSPPSIEHEVGPEQFWKLAYRVGIPNIMGGIFMAAPASLYATYRHDEKNPVWGLDDAKIVDYWRAQGGECGYLLDFPANHFLTTDGQAARDPQWFARKVREFKAA
jgi:glycosyltransferase involved in cell wall biosynthesis